MPQLNVYIDDKTAKNLKDMSMVFECSKSKIIRISLIKTINEKFIHNRGAQEKLEKLKHINVLKEEIKTIGINNNKNLEKKDTTI